MREWYEGPRNAKRRSKGLLQILAFRVPFRRAGVGNDYELALCGINLGSKQASAALLVMLGSTPPLHSTPLHSTPLTKSLHRIDSFVLGFGDGE